MGHKINKDARFAVIGYGTWATAIAGMLTRNGNTVSWYIRNPEVLEGLLEEGRNPKYLNELEFDKGLIRPSDNIDHVVSEAEIIIMCVPSAYLTTFLEPLTVPLQDKFIVTAIKGIIPGSYQTVAEYLHDTYGLSYGQIGIIAAPSHAEEVSRNKLSYLTIVCTDRGNAELIGDRLKSGYINLSYSSDIYGVEYAVILKNIYALAVGMADGLGYGDNFKAVLVAECAREMTRYLQDSYPAERDTLESAYLGDLLVTCYSTYSRNRRLGQLIGKGCTVKSALNEMTMIAEGYFASDCIIHMNKEHKINIPIADMVYDILYRGMSPRKRMKELSLLLR